MADKIPKPRTPGERSPAAAHARPNQNAILLALPRKERDAIFKKLEWVDLPVQTVLHEAGTPIQSAYFINGGLGSILSQVSNGKTVEVGLTGKEGFVGIPLLVGFASSPTRVVMQVAGNGFRIPTRDLKNVLETYPILERLLHRYTQELTLQATQVAACNRLHEVSKRLARWLLMSQDRLGGDDVPLTQQFLAHMLGTRRASVTVAAGVLQKRGLISYNRGKVKILKRRKLEQSACECYGKMQRQSRKWKSESKST